jgi:hypothetical protein
MSKGGRWVHGLLPFQAANVTWKQQRAEIATAERHAAFLEVEAIHRIQPEIYLASMEIRKVVEATYDINNVDIGMLLFHA